jgi:hypothetical protein
LERGREKKEKTQSQAEETDDRGEKDAEEEREFAEVFARCRCAVFFRLPQQEPARHVYIIIR